MLQLNPIPSVPATPPKLLSKEKQAEKLETKVEEPVVEREVVLTQASPVLSILHSLSSVDHLVITRRLHIKDALFLRGKRCRFFVNTMDQTLVYKIEESTGLLASYLCYGLRPLQLHVFNNGGTEVMSIQRNFACTARFLPCHMQHLEVYSPPGHFIGSVQQQWSVLKPLYLVLNENGDPLFWIRGPLITVCLYRDVQFQIQNTTNGGPIGSTSKRWQGLTHAMFFAAISDRFEVTFNMNLTVEEKALLLAASILMDYMYYDA